MAEYDDKDDNNHVSMMEHQEEPVSPGTRFLQTPGFNLFIVAVYGFKTAITDIDRLKRGFQENFLKHPRFSSILVMKGGKQSWRRTLVNLDEHVFIPDIDPEMEEPDKFVEDYASALSTTPMDYGKPLWESHVLNVPTSDANGVIVFRVHHMIGDGTSLISLLLACTRKSSDPQSLPSIPTKKREVEPQSGKYSIQKLLLFIWSSIVIFFNTVSGSLWFLYTTFWLADTQTPIKKPTYSVGLSPTRFVHRILNLDDVKLVKNALNTTINDVVLGVIQSGLSLYCNREYEKHNTKGFGSIKKSNYLPKNLRVNGIVAFNNRPPDKIEDLGSLIKKSTSDRRWGNLVGFVRVPFTISLPDNPLTHVYQVKRIVDRKKHSLESLCTYYVCSWVLKFLGMKCAAALTQASLSSSTFSFSNVAGPQEEITLFGYPISYIAPSVSGISQALVLHCMSYDNKLTISLAVDEDVIQDPHQLCSDLAQSLENMKIAVLNRGRES